MKKNHNLFLFAFLLVLFGNVNSIAGNNPGLQNSDVFEGDSICVTNLQIYAEICEGYPYTENGFNVDQPGVYQLYFVNEQGCDSVVTLNLHVKKCDGIYNEIHATIDCGESYLFCGNYLTQSGTYYCGFDTLGMDSIINEITTLYLTVLPCGNDSNLNVIHATVDCGGNYFFCGETLTVSGVYYCGNDSAPGMDSTFNELTVLYLTVLPCDSNYVTIYDTIACGESYYFCGQILTESGTYYCERDPIQSSLPLISKVLYLTVLPCDNDSNNVIYATIDCGESYLFCGNYLTQSGTYYCGFDTLGMDSIFNELTTLYLTVLPCDNDSNMNEIYATIRCDESYFFCGEYLTQSGTYYCASDSVQGMDSLWVTLHLTVLSGDTVVKNVQICAGEVFVFNGKEYSETGIYYDYVSSGDDCIVTYMINLVVINSFFVEFTDEICSGEEYDFMGQVLTEPGKYLHTLVSVAGCDSILVLNLLVDYDCENGDMDDSDFIRVYPNPVSNHLNLMFAGEEMRRVEIYDLTGQLFYSAKHNVESVTVDVSKFANGFYVLKVDGVKKEKILIRH